MFLDLFVCSGVVELWVFGMPLLEGWRKAGFGFIGLYFGGVHLGWGGFGCALYLCL